MYGPVVAERPSPQPTSLMDLPNDLVARVIGAADQCGAVGCMLASKQLYAAVRNPAIWTTVELGVLDASAIDFMQFASECHTLKIETPSLDDVVWFLLGCHSRAVAALETVSTMEISVTERCERMTSALFEAVANFPALKTLAITLAGVSNSDDISVDIRMPALESLTFQEHEDVIEDLHNYNDSVAVNLDFAPGCQFPALKKLHIASRSANVFQLVPGLPLLTSLVYVSHTEWDWEEQLHVHLAPLAGRYLEEVTLCLHAGSDAMYQFLQHVGYVERLQLLCFHDVSINRPLTNVEQFDVVLGDMVTLSIDFATLSELSEFESLAVSCPFNFQNGDVHILGCPSMFHWVRFWQRKLMTTSFVTVTVDHRMY